MKRSLWHVASLTLILAALACSLPGATSDPALQATQMAVAVQQTSLAIQQATLSAAGGAISTQAPPNLAPTYTPYPTYTAGPEGVSASSTPESVSLHDRIKVSNVLIYEDIMGYPILSPIVNNTVNSMGFSGGRVINTGDALGDFKAQANSATKWDLMIVASEVRSSFSGEMFEMMYNHIDNGGAVIIEVWHLDKIANGKIAPILSKCGVGLFRDWTRDNNYDPFKYSIYWLDTSHPLLSTPNVLQAPSYPYPEWFGDAGDLLELSSGGDAVLVGGLYPNRKTDYGVVAVCLGGRMVIQTFSSHDYELGIVQPIWVNYINYTLTKHYEYTP